MGFCMSPPPFNTGNWMQSLLCLGKCSLWAGSPTLRHCLTNRYVGFQFWKSNRSQASNHTRLMLCRFQGQMDLGCWNKASEEPINRGKKHSAVSILHSFRNLSSLGKSLNSIYPQKKKWIGIGAIEKDQQLRTLTSLIMGLRFGSQHLQGSS